MRKIICAFSLAIGHNYDLDDSLVEKLIDFYIVLLSFYLFSLPVGWNLYHSLLDNAPNGVVGCIIQKRRVSTLIFLKHFLPIHKDKVWRYNPFPPGRDGLAKHEFHWNTTILDTNPKCSKMKSKVDLKYEKCAISKGIRTVCLKCRLKSKFLLVI